MHHGQRGPPRGPPPGLPASARPAAKRRGVVGADRPAPAHAAARRDVPEGGGERRRRGQGLADARRSHRRSREGDGWLNATMLTAAAFNGQEQIVRELLCFNAAKVSLDETDTHGCAPRRRDAPLRTTTVTARRRSDRQPPAHRRSPLSLLPPPQVLGAHLGVRARPRLHRQAAPPPPQRPSTCKTPRRTALMGACLVGHCSIVGALLKARVPPPSNRTMRRSHQLRGRRTRFCPRHPHPRGLPLDLDSDTTSRACCAGGRAHRPP